MREDSLLPRLGERLSSHISPTKVVVTRGPFSLVLSECCLVLSKSSVLQYEGVLPVLESAKSYLSSSLECFFWLEVGLEVNHVLGGIPKVLLQHN